VSRDNGKRRVYVEANVGGRDLGSFVDDAAARIARDVKLPPGMYIEWGGQFQNLQAATKRLAMIVPACFVLIAAALYMAIGNAMLTATVLTAVPLALAGGVFALRCAASRSPSPQQWVSLLSRAWPFSMVSS
jgi:cobalt-zinc-cadmium resistance protein CzcA